MPAVKKLTPDEVAELKLKSIDPGARAREEYDAMLADVNIGDFGELQLSDEEQERTRVIRTMLQHAATRRGIRLTFKGMVGTGRLIFEAVSRVTGDGIGAYQARTEEPKQEAPSVPTEKKRPGRPMKITKNVAK